jgi:hypothetical protein
MGPAQCQNRQGLWTSKLLSRSIRYMNLYINIADSAGVRAEDDLARALVAALRGDAHIEPPRADGFEALLHVIAQTTQVISHLDTFRELAIARADASGPAADRRKIGISAAMAPSRLYRILDRQGRPRKRDYAAYNESEQRMLASLVKGHIVEGSYQGEPFAGSYISQNSDEDGNIWLVLTDHNTQKPVVIPAEAVSSYH